MTNIAAIRVNPRSIVVRLIEAYGETAPLAGEDLTTIEEAIKQVGIDPERYRAHLARNLLEYVRKRM